MEAGRGDRVVGMWELEEWLNLTAWYGRRRWVGEGKNEAMTVYANVYCLDDGGAYTRCTQNLASQFQDIFLWKFVRCYVLRLLVCCNIVQMIHDRAKAIQQGPHKTCVKLEMDLASLACQRNRLALLTSYACRAC